MTVADKKNPFPSSPAVEPAAWFCLRSQTKHEHIAAAHLRQTGAAEVFLPRIRFRRATRQGNAWVTEALFPGYFFARFDWQNSLRQVQHARGVRGVVHFGEHWPTIPEETIGDLRRAVGATELCVVPAELAPGDDVQITEGSLRGIRAVVARVMPSRERVAVLMEFLGRQTMIELPASAVIKEGDRRADVF
jgi:transcriptional antiterminator RfaH